MIGENDFCSSGETQIVENPKKIPLKEFI